MINKNTN